MTKLEVIVELDGVCLLFFPTGVFYLFFYICLNIICGLSEPIEFKESDRGK